MSVLWVKPPFVVSRRWHRRQEVSGVEAWTVSVNRKAAYAARCWLVGRKAVKKSGSSLQTWPQSRQAWCGMACAVGLKEDLKISSEEGGSGTKPKWLILRVPRGCG